MNKVTVILPTYNRAQSITRSIRSVLSQTYQDFEFIIIDDGSIDNTEKIVRKFQEKDKRIRYIRHNKNKGSATARNTGIKAAKREYIAFQDSDDEWLPEKLEKQMKVFKNVPPKVGVVYTGFWKIDGDKRKYIPSSRVKQKEGDIHKKLLNGNFVDTPTVLIKKECFEKVGIFDEHLCALEDWELWIRVSKHYHFKFIDEPLLISHYTSNSVNINLNSLIWASKLILEEHFEEFKRERKALIQQIHRIGSLLCQNGKMVQGRNYLSQALRSYPLNPKYLMSIFISLFGQNTYNYSVKIYRRIKTLIDI